jgi:hypothetical protein
MPSINAGLRDVGYVALCVAVALAAVLGMIMLIAKGGGGF